MVRSFGLAVALLVAGCGGDDEGCDANAPGAEPPVCESGKVDACACPDGTMGAQACADDGSKWGACACADPPKPGDPGQPKAAYYAEDLCEPTDDPDRAMMCREGAGTKSRAFINCVVPDDGELIGCLRFRDEACCFPK